METKRAACLKGTLPGRCCWYLSDPAKVARGRNASPARAPSRRYLAEERRAFFSHASAASHALRRPPCEASPKYALDVGREPTSVIR